MKLAREFKRADRAQAHVIPTGTTYDQHCAAAERAEYLLVRTKPVSPQGAASLLDTSASFLCGTLGEHTERELRRIARNWRNGRHLPDDFIVARQIAQLVNLMARGTWLSEENQDNILAMLNNALGFMCRPRLV
ncbi:MAG TPA: hypothetical protein VIE66_02720 [Methylocella sp.]